jgi:hypothetical protein
LSAEPIGPQPASADAAEARKSRRLIRVDTSR